jgi:hypothetical protein
MTMKKARMIGALMVVALLGACSSSSSPDSGAYTLSVALTDKPMMSSVQAVMVTISAVRVHESAVAGVGDPGWREMPVTAAMPVDLMKLQGGVIQELCREQLTPGTYQQIRLQLVPNEAATPPFRNSVTMMGGAVQPMDVPGDSVKIVHPFTVVEGARTRLVLDLDAGDSCRQRGDETWFMQPVVSATSQMM